MRSRGIKAVIPEPADQAAHRQRRGSDGGRPVSYDVKDYKNRNVIERAFNGFKNWRGLASRYDKHASSIEADLSSLPSSCGIGDCGDTP